MQAAATEAYERWATRLGAFAQQVHGSAHMAQETQRVIIPS
jgi:predicted trehalose synthase